MIMSEFANEKTADGVRRASAFAGLVLRGKFERWLNPNVIDANYSLSFHIQNGIVSHVKEKDSEPAYVTTLERVGGADSSQIVASCKAIIEQRLETCLVPGWNGVAIISIAFFCGEATISSTVERNYRQA